MTQWRSEERAMPWRTMTPELSCGTYYVAFRCPCLKRTPLAQSWVRHCRLFTCCMWYDGEREFPPSLISMFHHVIAHFMSDISERMSGITVHMIVQTMAHIIVVHNTRTYGLRDICCQLQFINVKNFPVYITV